MNRADSQFASRTLTRTHIDCIMTVKRGALRQAVSLNQVYLTNVKQPSLGRVAVVAFLRDKAGEWVACLHEHPFDG